MLSDKHACQCLPVRVEILRIILKFFSAFKEINRLYLFGYDFIQYDENEEISADVGYYITNFDLNNVTYNLPNTLTVIRETGNGWMSIGQYVLINTNKVHKNNTVNKLNN